MPTANASDVPVQAEGVPLHLGEHALRHLADWLDRLPPTTAVLVLADTTTAKVCAPLLLNEVPALREREVVQVPAGELSKSIDVCRALWEHLASRAAGRDAVLVNLGGGVITDLGGFVAATYKRGIRFVHVPTTLLGMVDGAIGGKTAIDVGGIKNLVGAFARPEMVCVQPAFLRTLGKRELLNGVAEMVKHGLIRDATHWNEVRRARLHDLDALGPLIQRSATIKAEVVTADPREQGPRKLLNFGHTIGHALEAFALESPDHDLLHGEAVAIGMVCAAWLSWRLGHLDRDRMNAVQEHLMGLYPPFHFGSADHHRIVELMRNDKKNVADGFRFTLLTGIGEAIHDVPVTAAQVSDALDHYRLLVRDAEREHPKA
jgi:3-dehydroquinate synthase